MSKSAAPIFPFRDAWLVVLPVLPLMFFTGMLSWLIDPAVHLAFLDVTPNDFIVRPQREYVHLGDMLTYYSLAAFHTLLCVAVDLTLPSQTITTRTIAQWKKQRPLLTRRPAVFLLGSPDTASRKPQ